MAKKSLPILTLTEVAWECPYCHRGNGVPEVTECACGAVRVGDHAEAPDTGTKPSTPAKAVTTADGGTPGSAADEE